MKYLFLIINISRAVAVFFDIQHGERYNSYNRGSSGVEKEPSDGVAKLKKDKYSSMDKTRTFNLRYIGVRVCASYRYCTNGMVVGASSLFFFFLCNRNERRFFMLERQFYIRFRAKHGSFPGSRAVNCRIRDDVFLNMEVILKLAD